MTLVRSHWGIALRFGYPFSISGPFLSQFCIGSSVRSLPPLVHGFPYPDDASRIARRRHTVSSMFIPYSLVFRVFSSTLLPGFIGPESSVPPVNLPPSAPLRFGVSSSIRFAVVSTIAPALFYLRPSVGSSGNINDRTGGLPWVRRTTSPYAVRLHVGSVLRISGLA